MIRKLGLSGFFILHRDLLELAREVAAEVRGAGRGAGAAAAGPRPRVLGVVHRLLPHRPLAHRPDRERALPRPLPQRGAHRAAGHRPRLPARHPRGADPARARALRQASTRRWWRRSRPTARAGRSARSARRSACRRGRSSASRGWPSRGRSRSRRTSSSRSARRPRRRRAPTRRRRPRAPCRCRPTTAARRRPGRRRGRAEAGDADAPRWAWRDRTGGPDPALAKVAVDGNSGTALAVLTAPMLAAAERAGSSIGRDRRPRPPRHDPCGNGRTASTTPTGTRAARGAARGRRRCGGRTPVTTYGDRRAGGRAPTSGAGPTRATARVGRRRAVRRDAGDKGWAPARGGRGGGRASGPLQGRWGWLSQLAEEAYGLPRHLSQHPGGMIVSTRPLVDCVPLVPGRDGGPADVPLGQGLVRGRGLPEDRPARARDAVGGRALRGGDRPHAARADRPQPHPLRRQADLRGDPEGGHDGRLPDREPRADAVAAAHAARDAGRPHGPGGDRAAGADRRRRGEPVHRPQAEAAREPGLRDPLRPPVAGGGAQGHARDDHLPGPGARGRDGVRRLLAGGGGGAAAGDEPQALGGGDRGLPRALRGRRGGAPTAPTGRRRSACSR